jgi:hypothetical protein
VSAFDRTLLSTFACNTTLIYFRVAIHQGKNKMLQAVKGLTGKTKNGGMSTSALHGL